ncbi:formate/nitrite transporter family protein, partial [Shigella sonnei]|uniref:formate/nitrite transporter family protein n=1 Tax=Shigella sonnei TaxID=624 RepID=UPI00338DEB45
IDEDRLPSRAMAIHEHIRQDGEKELERDVIMARQQLFTENTVTAVLPVMQKPTMSNVGLLMRLWGVVLLGNILGTGIA